MAALFEFVNKILKAPGSHDSWKSEGKGVVTILLSNGEVMEFPRGMKCSELLASNPKYSVCQAAELVLRRRVKLLPPNSYLETGQIYLFLPNPGRTVSRSASEGKCESSSLLQDDSRDCHTVPASCLKFSISKQYLAKILAEEKSSATSFTEQTTDSSRQISSTAKTNRRGRVEGSSWSRRLDSIAEVA